MEIICEMCGRHSQDERRCTHCGAQLITDDEIAMQEEMVRWGWATFTFAMSNLLLRNEALLYLREKWMSLEEFTVLNLIDSQIDRFRLDAASIKVLVREDFFLAIAKELGSKFKEVEVAFDPVSLETAEEANALLNQR